MNRMDSLVTLIIREPCNIIVQTIWHKTVVLPGVMRREFESSTRWRIRRSPGVRYDVTSSFSLNLTRVGNEKNLRTAMRMTRVMLRIIWRVRVLRWIISLSTVARTASYEICQSCVVTSDGKNENERKRRRVEKKTWKNVRSGGDRKREGALESRKMRPERKTCTPSGWGKWKGEEKGGTHGFEARKASKWVKELASYAALILLLLFSARETRVKWRRRALAANAKLNRRTSRPSCSADIEENHRLLELSILSRGSAACLRDTSARE